jgi:hypothetical protein
VRWWRSGVDCNYRKASVGATVRWNSRSESSEIEEDHNSEGMGGIFGRASTARAGKRHCRSYEAKGVFGTDPLQFLQLHSTNSTMEQLNYGVRGAGGAISHIA